MASLQDLRRRISSVRNTRKITKALELVAGARLRRAQSRIEEMRPYADRMQELMIGTAQAASSLRNLALLQQRDEVRRVAFVVVTGDRGLAGPFNGQVLRRAFELERQARAEGQEVVWLAVGRKGASTLRFRRYEVTAQWAGFADKPGYHDAQAVGHKLAHDGHRCGMWCFHFAHDAAGFKAERGIEFPRELLHAPVFGEAKHMQPLDLPVARREQHAFEERRSHAVALPRSLDAQGCLGVTRALELAQLGRAA